MKNINKIIKHIFPVMIILLILVCISSASAEENNTNHAENNIETNIDNNHNTLTKNVDTELKTNNQTINKIYVSNKGNDSNIGSKEYPKASIKNAIENVANNGTIYLKEGTYNESGIYINKNISIIGDNTKNTVINSQKKHTITITSNVFLKAFTIENAKCKGNGGAIYNKGTLTMEGIKIRTSSASELGGAIYNKGKLTARKSSFSSNNANTGGAIYNINKLTLNRCTFSNNKAYNTSSSIYTNNYMNLYYCNFTNNKNTPLIIEKTDRLQLIRSSLFISNNGSYAGAVYNKNNNLTIEKTYFGNNKVSHNGGAIYNLGKINLINSTFTANNARYGGAIYNNNTLLLTDNSLKDNNATGVGGAIYNTNKITINNTKFNNNKAQKGGALFSQTQTPSEVSISNSVITNNIANIGGALYIYNQSKLNIKNSSFNANKENAIYINTNIKNNQIYNSTFTKNNATYGGAIRNANSHLTIKKSIFNGNNAKSGRALHNYHGNVTINYNSITNNNQDIYNYGTINADYNWWGTNNINKNRTINTKINNWIYLSIKHQYTQLINSNINTTISLYNIKNENTITTLPTGTDLPTIQMKITITGPGINKQANTSKNYLKLTNKFNKTGNVIFTVKAPTQEIRNILYIHEAYASNMFVKNIQSYNTEDIQVPVNVTDELNNTINEGILDLYLNNKKIQTKEVTTSNLFIIPKQKTGVYDIKIVFTSPEYKTISKTVKLTVNPKNDYTIRVTENPSLITGQRGTLRGQVHNIITRKTINTGTVKFYFDNKYIGSSNTKNNLSSYKLVMPEKAGEHTVKVEYYQNNKFITAATDTVYVNKRQEQIAQNTFITLQGDLISNTKITSTKKDVYFAMDRTTASYNYSPNDMKIMNNIAYNLRSNGFNVKTVKNGPGETYETANYMYKNNIRNSICFVLCNGVDANVIREYLKGYDRLLTTVRNRGNDIVLGWFYGAGDIYNPEGEYYYWLEKAWDDNYSNWGGIANARKTMEKDGIKIVYEKYDLNGDDVARSFTKLYGGKITENVTKNSDISLKTNIYTTNNQKINGNVVYTLNNKIIHNASVTGNSYTFKYTMPSITGTYNLKATYYSNNKAVCSTNRTLKVI